MLNMLAKFSYTYPKYNLPVTDEVKEIIHKTYSINYNKIDVIQHGIDTDIYTFEEKKREKQFVLMYSGSLVESYDFDIIIKAAQKLKDKNIQFVIRGRGILLSYLQEQKEKFNLDNVIIDTNFVPLDQISNILSKSDVLLAPMADEYAINTNLPTKIIEYQAVGRPIICCSNGAPGNYIEKTKSGIRISHGDLDAFIDAILKLESDPLLCNTLGKNGRMFVEENLTFEKIGKRLSEIIQRVLYT
ncbi:MAG: glycosyltransferase, partial [Rhabdochlamydiaceae bacterium]